MANSPKNKPKPENKRKLTEKEKKELAQRFAQAMNRLEKKEQAQYAEQMQQDPRLTLGIAIALRAAPKNITPNELLARVSIAYEQWKKTAALTAKPDRAEIYSNTAALNAQYKSIVDGEENKHENLEHFMENALEDLIEDEEEEYANAKVPPPPTPFDTEPRP